MGANFEANSECYRQIPCATEQGITFARTGNFEQRNRECIRAIRESVYIDAYRLGFLPQDLIAGRRWRGPIAIPEQMATIP